MDTEDSFDDDVGGQALHVEDDDNDLDLDIPPTSGNEYLRRVRMETSTVPRVVVADIDTKAFNKKQTVHVKQWTSALQPAPCGFAPSQAWQNTQVADFAQQRQKLARYKAKRKHLRVSKLPKVPQANDVEAWCRLCFGRIKPPARGNQSTVIPSAVGNQSAMMSSTQLSSAGVPSTMKQEEQMDTSMEDKADDTQSDTQTFPSHEGILPLVSVMVAMDQSTVIKVLEYHLNWFEATGFTEKQGYWFYALLICLDKPLLPDACALLRSLARACSRLRASLDSRVDFKLVPLNLFICLISRYFDQSDLKDDVG